MDHAIKKNNHLFRHFFCSYYLIQYFSRSMKYFPCLVIMIILNIQITMVNLHLRNLKGEIQ